MARLDAHNACPVCARPVQEVYFSAQVLVDLIDGGVLALEEDRALLLARVTDLRAAVRALQPMIEAHHANQDHLLSPELAGARDPQQLVAVCSSSRS